MTDPSMMTSDTQYNEVGCRRRQELVALKREELQASLDGAFRLLVKRAKECDRLATETGYESPAALFAELGLSPHHQVLARAWLDLGAIGLLEAIWNLIETLSDQDRTQLTKRLIEGDRQ